ncbi:hypothetical protein FB45DRAFT_923038 [Roridomyces roridus]|uniref:Yeast cell wall synthesis Kre9/Knh1-like N-terminal domain-containing protein n=1 Tax=Roridomyces roridus TaxID=1738132 RepID=A0AAD7FL68_9AGAR|nr:hypothetical protein FB45DRAFT_923038 [Roridomyces roridus]
MFSLTKTIWPILVTASGVLSLTLNAPTTAQSGSSTTITWTSTSTDPTFSIELAHPDLNAAIAVANNVNPANNQITVTLPIVQAGDGYTLEAVNITDINQVFSTSGDFSIAAAPSPSPSSSTPIASAPPSAPISVASVPLTPSGVSGSLPASSLSVPSPSV